MFEFLLVIGLILAYYGYSVTRNPHIWGDQGKDRIKEEYWREYVLRNGRFVMYAGFLLAALAALDAALTMESWLFLVLLLGGLGLLGYPLAHWMKKTHGTWNPWPRKQKDKKR